MIASKLTRWAAYTFATFLLGFFALMAWPERPPTLLVSPEGWYATGAFVPMQPDTTEVRTSVIRNPQARFWRSWSPTDGSSPGRIHTAPFRPTEQLVVPYNGFSGQPGIGTYLECMATGERRHLATGRNNTQWAEIFVPSPTWCPGDLRIVAESESSESYVSIGTPYQVSRLSALKRSPLASVCFLLISWVAIAGSFLAMAKLALKNNWRLGPVASGFIGLGLIGYIQFFVLWAFPSAGRLLAVALVLAGTMSTIRHFLTAHRLRLPSDLSQAINLWLVAATALILLALVGDTGAGPWLVNERFSPVRWSSDNQIPSLVGHALSSGRHAVLSAMSPWTIADRPPLAYGWHGTMHVVFDLMTSGNDGKHVAYLHQLAVGVVLSTAWVPLLTIIARRVGASRLSTNAIVAVALLSPFLLFNSVYVWPKLLSGTFGLLAAWMLFGPDAQKTRLRMDTPGLLGAAVLSALALLTHGGSAFGIAAMLMLTPFYRGIPSWRGAFLAVAAAAALLLPWSYWQALVAPPGNALVKMAFAGTFGFGEENVGVLETILRSYHALTPQSWLQKKLDGVLTMIFGLRNTCGLQEMGRSFSWIDRWRASDFYYVMPSLNLLALGFLPIFAGLLRKKKDVSGALVLFGVTTLALTLLLSWECYIIHHQSYQALMALHFGLIIALIGSGILGRAVLLGSAAYGLAVWIVEPLQHFPRIDYTAGALFAISVFAWGWLAYRTRLPAEGH